MGSFVDLTGRRFGKLVVVKQTEKRNAAGSVIWECKCDCGNTKYICGNSLNGGHSKSCGCMQNKIENLLGRRFGRLVVTRFDYYAAFSHSVRWICKCDCGKEKSVLASCLKGGSVTSCGCFSSEQKSKRTRKHGFGNGDRLFRIWSGMKSRCYSQNDRNYKRYGARGIRICDEWLKDFMSFREWSLKNGYAENLSIDRIDNDASYSPDNCRWCDKKAQSNNRRTNVIITYNGEKHTASEWSDIVGIKAATLVSRKSHGWTDKECIEIPVLASNNQTTRRKQN